MHESASNKLKEISRDLAVLAASISDPAARLRFVELTTRSTALLLEGSRLCHEAFALLPADRRPTA